MATIDAKTVAQLRKQTGAPMMDCKHALEETGGDIEEAILVLRKKGLKTAEQRAGRQVAEGRLFSYVHHNGKLAVLAEVLCETDFVARNEEFLQFGKDLCVHIAASAPRFVSEEDVDPAVLEREREVAAAQAREDMAGKPEEIVNRAIEGRVKKFVKENCLLMQPWLHDANKTVDQVRNELVAKIGENVQIRRFVRLELGR